MVDSHPVDLAHPTTGLHIQTSAAHVQRLLSPKNWAPGFQNGRLKTLGLHCFNTGLHLARIIIFVWAPGFQRLPFGILIEQDLGVCVRSSGDTFCCNLQCNHGDGVLHMQFHRQLVSHWYYAASCRKNWLV